MSAQPRRLALLAAAIATLSVAGATALALMTTAPAAARSLAQAADGPVRHVVVFKYAPTATPAQIQQVTTAFAALRQSIPGITAFEHGVNNSPEQKNLGFTHAYVVTFTDAAARDAYLPHPEHQKFGQLLGKLGILEDAFVVDYVPQP